MRAFGRTLRRRPLRKLLTLLQLLLGSLATTLALSPYLTPTDTARQDQFYLTAGFQDENGENLVYSVFSEYRLESFKALAPAVQNLAVYTTGVGDAELAVNGKRFAFKPQASVTVSLNYPEIAGLKITGGSAFSRADTGEAVVLVSDDSARRIFGNTNPLGQTLLKVQSDNFYSQDVARVDPVPYRVVGTFADTPNTLDTTPGIIFPTWAPESFTGGGAFGGGTFSQLLVQAKPGQVEAAKTQILAAVREQYHDDPLLQDAEVGQDFFVSDVADFTNSQAPFNPNLVILALFGVVSLIIGSVGLFSVVLIEVLERTYEIGLKRALGASRLAICREFVAEAAGLSLMGAVTGIGAAALLTQFLAEQLGNAFFYGLSFSWQWRAALIVISAGIAFGALIGFFPIFRATRRAPITSLRSQSENV